MLAREDEPVSANLGSTTPAKSTRYNAPRAPSLSSTDNTVTKCEKCGALASCDRRLRAPRAWGRKAGTR